MKKFDKIEKTENNLPFINFDKKYNYLLMGMSNGRLLSRGNNKKKLNQILGTDWINISQGFGRCGMRNQYLYLKYFFEQKNKVKKVLFLVSPVIFYEELADINSLSFANEQLNCSFFKFLLKNKTENTFEHLFYYFQAKASVGYFKQNTSFQFQREDTIKLPLDTNFYLNKAMPNRTKNAVLYEKILWFEKILQLVKCNNTEIAIISSPTLIGKLPGTYLMNQKIDSLQSIYKFQYFNFADEMLDKNMYYDFLHFNSSGVHYFCDNLLECTLIDY
jgi:hypothetical protein